MNTPLELSDALVLLLTAGIGFLVTNGLKSFLPGADISGVSAKVTAGIVTAFVALVNFGLGFVPVQYHEAVMAVFAVIVSILEAYGIHYSIRSAAKARAAK